MRICCGSFRHCSTRQPLREQVRTATVFLHLGGLCAHVGIHSPMVCIRWDSCSHGVPICFENRGSRALLPADSLSMMVDPGGATPSSSAPIVSRCIPRRWVPWDPSGATPSSSAAASPLDAFLDDRREQRHRAPLRQVPSMCSSMLLPTSIFPLPASYFLLPVRFRFAFANS